MISMIRKIRCSTHFVGTVVQNCEAYCMDPIYASPQSPQLSPLHGTRASNGPMNLDLDGLTHTDS